jgi:hypothetical protein
MSHAWIPTRDPVAAPTSAEMSDDCHGKLYRTLAAAIDTADTADAMTRAAAAAWALGLSPRRIAEAHSALHNARRIIKAVNDKAATRLRAAADQASARVAELEAARNVPAGELEAARSAAFDAKTAADEAVSSLQLLAAYRDDPIVGLCF